MTGFTTDGDLPPETPIQAADQDYATTPPTAGDALTSMAANSFGLPAASRAVERSEYDTSGSLSGIFGRALAAAGETGGGLITLPSDVQLQLPSMAPIVTPTLSAADANARYAPTGPDGQQVPIATDPMPEGVAQLVGQAKADEIEREGVISRFENAHGPVTNFAMGTAAYLMDPLRAATMLVPGIGEEAITGGLARAGFTGLAARTAARVVAGGTSAAVAQAPISALGYLTGQGEASDYGLRQAFSDMFFAAAGGAVFHAGLGAVGDALGHAPQAAQVLGADAITKHDAMSTAIGQVTDGRMVDVLPILNMRDLSAMSEEAQLRATDAQLAEHIASLPEGDPAAAERLNRLSAVESQLSDENISPEMQRQLSTRRDELLTDTTPEQLAADAAPIEQRRIAENSRASIAARLDQIQQDRTAGLADTALSPLPKMAPPDLASVAAGQRELYNGGYAQGIPQPEFDAARQAIYGPAPKAADAAVAASKVASATAPLDSMIAEAEGHLQSQPLHPDDAAEIARTSQGVQQASDISNAYQTAGACLAGGFM